MSGDDGDGFFKPAIGERGGPAPWDQGADAPVGLSRPDFGDAKWSCLFDGASQYASDHADPAEVGAAGRRMRGGDTPAEVINGPFIKAPVWTWEVPLYFWFGGIAAGSSFVALAADLAGDHRSGAVARKVALAALAPCPPLLIADLGRPARFVNMLRIFKPRSPMNSGAWALSAFGVLGTGAVAADLVGRHRTAAVLGAANTLVGGYLGSYTGVLLGVTAVPVWARSRSLLGPIFVATATATGAAASRLAIVSTGLAPGHPTATALARLETGAIASELALTWVNRRRLGAAATALEAPEAKRLFTAAQCCVSIGLALHAVRALRLGATPRIGHVTSALYLAGGLAFRYAWFAAGRASASDDRVVADAARRATTSVTPSLRRQTTDHGTVGARYAEAVRRIALAIERKAH